MRSRSKGAWINKLKANAEAYSFLLLFLAFYLSFMFYPLVQGFIISMADWDIVGEKTFVGFKNYGQILQDAMFWSSLWNSTKFVLMSVPALMVVSFSFALLIDSKFIRGRVFFRAAFFLPVILSVSIISIIWSYSLEPYSGSINTILAFLGFEHTIFWTGEPRLVWTTIAGVTVWWTMGNSMILYLAGLQDIPPDLYEAAEIDGASKWQKTVYITIPALNRVHTLILFLSTIASFKVFGQIFLITGGGPAGSTRALIQYIYEIGFTRYEMGPASAAAFILFLFILLITMLQMRIARSSQGQEEA